LPSELQYRLFWIESTLSPKVDWMFPASWVLIVDGWDMPSFRNACAQAVRELKLSVYRTVEFSELQ
jgi:hypothetical protein